MSKSSGKPVQRVIERVVFTKNGVTETKNLQVYKPKTKAPYIYSTIDFRKTKVPAIPQPDGSYIAQI